MMEKNVMQGQIREFVKKENIREKAANFTREIRNMKTV
jgi:hypothetical protein